MLKLKRNLFFVIGFALTGCDLSVNMDNVTTQSNVNQYNPTLMIFPSDALLRRLSCIKEIENQGTTSYDRNYGKSFIQDSELKFVIASIEETFSKANYPLENLEQQLKQIANEKATDAMEGVSSDARTLLMNTARPDFIIEIDYEYRQDPTSRNPKKILTYLLTAIDAYTNKTVASITRTDIGKGSDGASLSSLIKDDLDGIISDFQNQINQRFKDLLANGVEISLRIVTDENTNFNLGDECLGNENYNDWVNTWLKDNTVQSAYKSVKNTDKELKFTNVRIQTLKSDGRKYTAYDFANDLRKDISKACGVSAVNRTQGIGDAYIIITGLR
jgi:hypothetical protein